MYQLHYKEMMKFYTGCQPPNYNYQFPPGYQQYQQGPPSIFNSQPNYNNSNEPPKGIIFPNSQLPPQPNPQQHSQQPYQGQQQPPSFFNQNMFGNPQEMARMGSTINPGTVYQQPSTQQWGNGSGINFQQQPMSKP